jgi:hypothetical protein
MLYEHGEPRWNDTDREKPVPVPLRPPQIPHELTQNPGLCGERLANNSISDGTAIKRPTLKEGNFLK